MSPTLYRYLLSYFNPRAPRGARPQHTRSRVPLSSFQSTGPSRSPTCHVIHGRLISAHFNPRAPRGARPHRARRECSRRYFNPRAPRGARLDLFRSSRKKRPISIHGPLAEPDLSRRVLRQGAHHFNPRAPRGARLKPSPCSAVFAAISIHGPLAEPDAFGVYAAVGSYISIHGPLAEPDVSDNQIQVWQDDFNPRAPRGARRGSCSLLCFGGNISIHGPLAEPDDQPLLDIVVIDRFQSTGPSRSPTIAVGVSAAVAHFNPRAPRGARLCELLV